MMIKEVREKAIRIAIGTFLSDWEGDAVDVFNKLIDETSNPMISEIDYVTAWEPFEDYEKEEIQEQLHDLAQTILLAMQWSQENDD